MSLGVEGRGRTAGLRALAHPVRLRILSLLTGGPMTAADVSRELGISHANASYHVRQLLAVDAIEPAGEEVIRGGTAKRYRYRIDKPPMEIPDPRDRMALYGAMASELRRRALALRPGRDTSHSTDAELWVEPDVWRSFRSTVEGASNDLHWAARPPRTPGTIRVNATMVLFEMEPEG